MKMIWALALTTDFCNTKWANEEGNTGSGSRDRAGESPLFTMCSVPLTNGHIIAKPTVTA